MIGRFLRFLWVAALLPGIALPVPAATASANPAPQTPEISQIIEQTRKDIPPLLEKHAIPGLAVAIVDDQSVLWAEDFGYTDIDHRQAVTADTPFSIQSMSKSFTATAVMMAVQDGLVDLDAPITEYLPDFTVRSIFEEHPERKMTLRHLLSHTAGFIHEAPIGNNYDLPTHTLDEHFASISDTWLRFPVGAHYAYSNLGIDLAGYILQVQSGKPFPQYMKEKVFEPLGMVNSSCDFAEIRARKDRAVGNNGSIFHPPVTMLLVPSGGVYTSANDLARYIQFHINLGMLDGQRILREDLANTMITPPFEPARTANYALGLGIGKNNNTRRVEHGGGGFGFLSDMVWYPELKIGFLVLTNSAAHEQQYALEQAIENRVLLKNRALYQERSSQPPPADLLPVPAEVADAQPEPLSDTSLKLLIETLGQPNDEHALRRRQGYTGDYHALSQGFPGDDGRLWLRDDGILFMNFNPLAEVEPGLFFDPEGDFIDLRLGRKSYRDIQIVRRDPAQGMMMNVLFAVCAAVFLVALFLRPGRALVGRIRRASHAQVAARGDVVPGWIAFAAGIGAVASLLSMGFLLLIPRMMWAPWPAPFPERDWYLAAILLMPYLGLAAAATIALPLARAWKERDMDWKWNAISAVALIAFNLVLIF